MNILYTCDNNYVWIMGVSLISLYENNKESLNLNVYLLGENITDENKDLLYDISKKYNRTITIIDVPKLDIPDILTSERWPLSSYTRLFSGVLLPSKVKKIIYLDCDTVICGNISDLDNIDLNENIALGVLDCISSQYKNNIGLSEKDPYINAGVLLINLDEMRKLNIKKAIDTYMKKYIKLINYADQDMLNGIFKGKIGILNPKYNIMTIDVVYNYDDIEVLRRPRIFYTKKELQNGINDRRIIHYTTNMRVVRPWYINSNHPLTNEFKKYMYISPWKDRTLSEMHFKSKEAKIIGIIEKLPKKVSYNILGLIHAKIKPLFIKVISILGI